MDCAVLLTGFSSQQVSLSSLEDVVGRAHRMDIHQENISMAAKKAPAIKDRYSKSQLLTDIAESTGLTRRQVGEVMDQLGVLIERHIKKRGCGEFVLPGLLKIVTRKKPAQKARKGVPNPFKPGELMDVPAKPATTQVKVRPLKKLKEFAAS
ncbi:hypothetical protein CI610_03081 [invertebrate metagenome]|uniref:DNA-binding protein n=1 Tax=invertebrate metagenome TaxID=1711999 RepID=A0A2H9T455_9ZZZZ